MHCSQCCCFPWLGNPSIWCEDCILAWLTCRRYLYGITWRQKRTRKRILGLKTAEVDIWTAPGRTLLVYAFVWRNVQSWIHQSECWSQCFCETKQLGTGNGYSTCWWHGCCHKQHSNPSWNGPGSSTNNWHCWHGSHKMVLWHGCHTRPSEPHDFTLSNSIPWGHLEMVPHGWTLVAWLQGTSTLLDVAPFPGAQNVNQSSQLQHVRLNMLWAVMWWRRQYGSRNCLTY